MTTREGFPTLWGQAEIHAYADTVCEELGKPPLKRGRTWTWYRVQGFPAPVATLEMGNVYLAEEMRPWVRQRIEAERYLTTRIDDPTRAEILAENGLLTAQATAVKYGVSRAMVHRIWAAGR
jgi:predicted DNA-binding transcriptional regulator AlpA